MHLPKPYAEYCLRSPLSEEALRAGFRRECPTSFFSWKLIKNSFSFQPLIERMLFRLKEKQNEVILEPRGNTRNSLRGIVHIHFQKDAHSSDTILNITIAPRDLRFFYLLYFALFFLLGLFCILVLLAIFSGAVPMEKYVHFPCVYLILLLMYIVIFKIMRYAALQELPTIQEKLEQLLQTIEQNPPDTPFSVR